MNPRNRHHHSNPFANLPSEVFSPADLAAAKAEIERQKAQENAARILRITSTADSLVQSKVEQLRKLRKEAEAVKDSLAKLSAARDAFLTSGNPEDLLKAIQQG